MTSRTPRSGFFGRWSFHARQSLLRQWRCGKALSDLFLRLCESLESLIFSENNIKLYRSFHMIHDLFHDPSRQEICIGIIHPQNGPRPEAPGPVDPLRDEANFEKAGLSKKSGVFPTLKVALSHLSKNRFFLLIFEAPTKTQAHFWGPKTNLLDQSKWGSQCGLGRSRHKRTCFGRGQRDGFGRCVGCCFFFFFTSLTGRERWSFHGCGGKFFFCWGTSWTLSKLFARNECFCVFDRSGSLWLTRLGSVCFSNRFYELEVCKEFVSRTNCLTSFCFFFFFVAFWCILTNKNPMFRRPRCCSSQDGSTYTGMIKDGKRHGGPPQPSEKEFFFFFFFPMGPRTWSVAV